MAKRKQWEKLTLEETRKIMLKHCKGCKYLIGMQDRYKTCNYILTEHKSRGCDVRDCKHYKD